MKFEHRFRVRASLEQVARFHRSASSMAAITPPPLVVQMHESPDTLFDGARMRFTLWVGPLPVRWLAEMDAISDTGFIDRQIEGPFATWAHQHRFHALSSDETEVTDKIEATLHTNPWKRFIGYAMWLSLPVTFAYRGWRTRRILEGNASGFAHGKQDGRRVA